MNYGYATDDDLLGTLEKDKEERYPLQMYRRLLSSLPIALEGQAGTHNLCSIKRRGILCSIPMNCFTCQFDRPVHATAITRDLSHL